MTSSAPVDIYFFPSIPTPVITQSNDTLFSSAADGNQWFMNGNPVNGANGAFYTPVVHGNDYYVTVSDTVGICSATSSIITGIADAANEIGISYNVYPNPISGAGILKLVSESNEPVLVEITDALGKVVFSQRSELKMKQQNEIMIDMSKESRGIYLLKVSTTKGSSTKKLVVY
jgi:hypothetical protein